MITKVVINKKMSMLIGNPIHRSYTQMTVTIFMIKNVALTVLNVSGHGLSETQKAGNQKTQHVVVKKRRLLSGVQVVQILQMDSVGPIVPSVARLASLTIQIQLRRADARHGNDS